MERSKEEIEAVKKDSLERAVNMNLKSKRADWCFNLSSSLVKRASRIPTSKVSYPSIGD